MSPASRLPAAFLASAALVVGGALTALPASAAVVPNVPVDVTPVVLVPAGTSVPVTFTLVTPKGETTTTLPAGTYWVESVLEEADGTTTTTWSAHTLAAPGELTVQSAAPAEGAAVSLAVMAAPAGAGDPTTMTPEQIEAALGDQAEVLDALEVLAANVTAPQTAPSFAELPSTVNPEALFLGDFHSLGVPTPAYRVGSKFVIAAKNGDPMTSTTMVFGRVGDKVVVGDWDGDGIDTFGVQRGSTFYFDNDFSGGVADHSMVFGRPGDLALAGDFDGDGTDTVALRRGTTFYVNNHLRGGTAAITFVYGSRTDVPLVGDFDHDGKDTIAVLRGPQLHVKNSLTGGPADEVVVSGSTELG